MKKAKYKSNQITNLYLDCIAIYNKTFLAINELYWKSKLLKIVYKNRNSDNRRPSFYNLETLYLLSIRVIKIASTSHPAPIEISVRSLLSYNYSKWCPCRLIIYIDFNNSVLKDLVSRTSLFVIALKKSRLVHSYKPGHVLDWRQKQSIIISRTPCDASGVSAFVFNTKIKKLKIKTKDRKAGAGSMHPLHSSPQGRRKSAVYITIVLQYREVFLFHGLLSLWIVDGMLINLGRPEMKGPQPTRSNRRLFVTKNQTCAYVTERAISVNEIFYWWLQL